MDSFRILQSGCKNDDKDVDFEPICYSCRRVDEEQNRLRIESENNEVSSYLSDLERFLDRKIETSTNFLFQVFETFLKLKIQIQKNFHFHRMTKFSQNHKYIHEKLGSKLDQK